MTREITSLLKNWIPQLSVFIVESHWFPTSTPFLCRVLPPSHCHPHSFHLFVPSCPPFCFPSSFSAPVLFPLLLLCGKWTWMCPMCWTSWNVWPHSLCLPLRPVGLRSHSHDSDIRNQHARAPESLWETQLLLYRQNNKWTENFTNLGEPSRC